MIEALNFKRLQEEVHDRYEYNEQCIVGIIFARYDLQHVQRIIEENYLYWNYNTKRYLDIFWAGYGEYLCPNDESATKKILKFEGIDTRIYYDLESVISVKEQFNHYLKDKDKLVELRKKLGSINLTETAKALNVGEMTLKDIIDELSKPGRDPREDMPKPILRQDVLKFEDLKEGMILTGTVRNVIDFGAFVDIGVKHDGLVHISEMSEKFVKNPSDIVSVGDIVKVKVIGIDNERQKVKLSMKIG